MNYFDRLLITIIHVLYESITCTTWLKLLILPGKWIQGKKRIFLLWELNLVMIYGLLVSFQTSGMKIMPIIVYATS